MAGDALDLAEAGPERELEASIEQRLIGRLLDEWRALRGHSALPPFSRIDPTALGEIWPWCYVLSLTPGQDDPVLVQAGAELLRDAGGIALPGPLSGLPPSSLIGQAVLHWPGVVERRVPISTGGTYPDLAGRTIRYRSVLMPLSEDGKGITHLLGAANGRVMVAI